MNKLSKIFIIKVLFFSLPFAFAAQDIWQSLELANYDSFFTKISKDNVVDNVLFEIDGEPYTLTDVVQFINERSAKAVTIKDLSKNISLFKNSLREMIVQALLMKEGEAIGIKVGDEEVNAYIEEIKKQNRVDAAGFKKLLSARDMTEGDYRRQVIVDILRSRVVSAKVRSRINVIEEEITKKYNEDNNQIPNEGEVEVEQIAFKFSDDASEDEKEELKNKLEEIKTKVQGGSNMEELGGDDYLNLGFVKPSDLLDDLQDSVRTLQQNEVSSVISTKDAYYLLKVKEHNKTAQQIDEQAKEKIRKEIYEEKFRTEVDKYIQEELVRKHVVELKIS